MPDSAIYHFTAIGLLAATLIAGNTAAADVPSTSSFIDKLPALHASTLVDGLYIWEAPDTSPSEYDRFIIEDIEIFIHPGSDYQGVDPVELLAVTELLRLHLIDALEPRYPVVNKPGPGVAHVRMAITGVKLKKRDDLVKGAFGTLPYGRAINRWRTPMVQLDEASMEMEILDSSTGKHLGLAIDPAALRHGKGKPNWESMDESFKFYASRMRQRMDDDRKK